MIYNDADVIVIGGGIAGSSTALSLAEKGRTVILLEKGRVGEEASGRCAGGVRQQNRNVAELPLAMESIKIWADMINELEYDVGYRRSGNLQIAMTPDEYTSLHRICEREKSMGLKVEMLSQRDVRGLISTIAKDWDFAGGKYCPTDGSANPLLVVKAICRMARKKGAAIREHEPVTGMTLKSGQLTSISTFDNEYHAGAFVIAAGPWTHKLCNQVGLDSPLMVHRDQILVTEPMQHHFDPFIIYGDMYMRRAIEGNVHLWGGHHPIAAFDKQLSYGAFAYAADRIATKFPYLKKVNIIRGFAGLTCYSPDEIPILDQIPNISNLFIAAGFSGHGFCLGPIVGKLMAEWIADGRPSLDLSAFRWGRNYNKNDSDNYNCL